MTIDELISITKALSDQQRVRAVLALQHGQLCVCQIIELLGLAPSTISKHMSILKQAGIVGSRKDGKWVYYFIAETAIQSGTMDFIKLTIRNLSNDPTIKTDKLKLQKIKKMDLNTLCRLFQEVV